MLRSKNCSSTKRTARINHSVFTYKVGNLNDGLHNAVNSKVCFPFGVLGGARNAYKYTMASTSYHHLVSQQNYLYQSLLVSDDVTFIAHAAGVILKWKTASIITFIINDQ